MWSERRRLADRLAWVSLDPPLLERFAFITPRGAPASPAMAALIATIERHLALEVHPMAGVAHP